MGGTADSRRDRARRRRRRARTRGPVEGRGDRLVVAHDAARRAPRPAGRRTGRARRSRRRSPPCRPAWRTTPPAWPGRAAPRRAARCSAVSVRGDVDRRARAVLEVAAACGRARAAPGSGATLGARARYPRIVVRAGRLEQTVGLRFASGSPPDGRGLRRIRRARSGSWCRRPAGRAPGHRRGSPYSVGLERALVLGRVPSPAGEVPRGIGDDQRAAPHPHGDAVQRRGASTRHRPRPAPMGRSDPVAAREVDVDAARAVLQDRRDPQRRPVAVGVGDRPAAHVPRISQRERLTIGRPVRCRGGRGVAHAARAARAGPRGRGRSPAARRRTSTPPARSARGPASAA